MNFRSIRSIRSKQGFSLVGIMIATALMGVLSLGIIEITQQQSKAYKQATTRFEVNSLSSAMGMLMMNSIACTNSLGGAGTNLANGQQVVIRSPEGVALFSTNDSYQNNTVTIESLTIQNLSVVGQTASMNIVASFRQAQSPLLPGLSIQRRFPIMAHLDAGGLLEVCYSVEGEAVLTARKLSCEKDLKGIWIPINAAGTDGYCQLQDVEINGDLYVKNHIKVDKTIKLGTPTGPCEEGQLAYDYTEHAMKYCNFELNWITVGQASGTLVGGFMVYNHVSGTIVGVRGAWGVAKGYPTIANLACPVGSKNVTISFADDTLGNSPTEYDDYGVDLYASCVAGLEHMCHVTTVGCMLE